jgi:hypothetical protein
VIEHLSPQHVIDFVDLAADKVRPGGKVMLEPSTGVALHIRPRLLGRPRPRAPSAPGRLSSCSAAGRTHRDGEYRSPVADEQLVARPATMRKPLIAEPSASLLFGAQDYAVIATR